MKKGIDMDRDSQLKQEFDLLESWTQTLAGRVKNTPPLVWEILKSNDPLPTGCPSKGSVAVLQFRDVTKALAEVEGACQRIKAHLLNKYKEVGSAPTGDAD
jgi:hypothetical protein